MATFSPVFKDSQRWNGEPATFRPSTAATRRLCGRRGTPLSSAYDRSEWIAVTRGSLDDPAAVKPEVHHGVEGQVPWLHIADDLPREATSEAGLAARGQVSLQK